MGATRGNTNAGVQPKGCGCGCTGAAGVVKRFLGDQEKADRPDANRQELLKDTGEVEKRVTALQAKD